MSSHQIYIVLNEARLPLRVRGNGPTDCDPVMCFESESAAKEWMSSNNQTLEFTVLGVAADHQNAVAKILGESADKVNFMMIRRREESGSNVPASSVFDRAIQWVKGSLSRTGSNGKG